MAQKQATISRWLLLTLLITGIVVLLHLAGHKYSFPETVLRVSRWILAAILFAYGCVRRSLMTWIFVAMVIGGIVGYDFPRQAASLQIVTQIFLRLIKAIIAPL